jgi:hypothetical protein
LFSLRLPWGREAHRRVEFFARKPPRFIGRTGEPGGAEGNVEDSDQISILLEEFLANPSDMHASMRRLEAAAAILKYSRNVKLAVSLVLRFRKFNVRTANSLHIVSTELVIVRRPYTFPMQK